MADRNTEAALTGIEKCTEPEKLRSFLANARRLGNAKVEMAAIERLVTVGASKDQDDPLDALACDFWRSIHALEFALTDERGKTTRLSRTRQKIARAGVRQTLQDLTQSANPSEGYFLLRDRGMLEMSAESVVLRHPEKFDSRTIEAAQRRQASTDISTGN